MLQCHIDTNLNTTHTKIHTIKIWRVDLINFTSNLNALLLLSGQLLCSSLLNGMPFRGEKSFSLRSSLAFVALKRSPSVELAILYLIEWKHVELKKKGAPAGLYNRACADCMGVACRATKNGELMKPAKQRGAGVA